MTGTWAVVALLAPPAAAALAAVFLRPRHPSPWTVTGLNAALPGAGLAAAGRSTIEVVLGVMFAQASLILAGSAGELWMYVPSMVVGGAWGMVTTPLNPLARLVSIERHFERVAADRGSASPVARSPETSVTTRSGDEAETVIESQYSVEVRCTECGAAVAVPVLHHMAMCSFCGSRHLVVGHEETLYVTLPERVYDGNVLREALLDHYRYQHYLKLYSRSVSPLARQAT